MAALDADTPRLPPLPTATSVLCCLSLSTLYVASLYVWGSDRNRDEPATIKRRCCSVFVVAAIAPVFVYTFSTPELLASLPLHVLLGLRWTGLWQAAVLPLLLTMLFYIGPISAQIVNKTLPRYFALEYWRRSLQCLFWLRIHVMAPFTEEFVFRACMMPLILQSFTPLAAVFVTPLFFGVAHAHHILHHVRQGVPLLSAMLNAGLQFSYTTVFGFYTAYLFARTGHFVAPLLAHAFCNHMGLPHIDEFSHQPKARRILLIFIYIFGIVSFFACLTTVTQPSIYGNELYWS